MITLTAMETAPGFMTLAWAHDGVAFASGVVRSVDWDGALGERLRDGADVVVTA